MSAIDWLQRWYAGQVDGDWEHEFGIRIATLDNPGWTVEIDIQATSLEARTFTRVQEQRATDDWLDCRIADGKFLGDGDPSKLERILRIFLVWAHGAK